MKTSPLGALAALGSSGTWAYASARYALTAREVSPIRVNLVRMLVAWPFYLGMGLITGTLGHGVLPRHVGWLALSTICSYAFADSLFFAAARRIGVSSALAIASTYPLWAALKGTLVDGEPFGGLRATGTLLCVGGVAAIVRLSSTSAEPASEGTAPPDRLGVPLALVTSALWAGNSISIKAGSLGLSVWTVNSLRYLIAVAVLSTFVLLGRAPGPRSPSRGWVSILPAIVADCVVGSTLFVYGLGATDLAVGATLSSLAPLISLPIAVWMGAERLTAAKLTAVCSTVLGIALLAW
jgi:drug/metabolite transporter, DME family